MRVQRKAVKIRLAANHSNAIRLGIKYSVDAKKVVEDWDYSHPQQSTTPAEARQWTQVHVLVDNTRLNSSFALLYADGYALGQDIAVSLMSKLPIRKAPATLKAVKDLLIPDWGTWKPGYQSAANMLRPSSGLSKLLAGRNSTLAGIARTTQDRIGTILSEAIEHGYTPESTIKDINALLNDPERALMIAQTEMSRAVNTASRESYQETGVEMVSWLVSDPCDICQENEDASPIGIDEEFPSGDTEPPAHPNCICDLAPYVVDTQDTGGLDNTDNPDDVLSLE